MIIALFFCVSSSRVTSSLAAMPYGFTSWVTISAHDGTFP